MKLVCSQHDLNQHLALASRAVASRPTVPVLANVLLEVDGDTISLTGFDLSIGIKTSFKATSVEGFGKVALPARLLGDIVSRLPEGDVTLSFAGLDSDDTITCQIKSKFGKYQVHAMSADDFPDLPDVESEAITLPSATLIEGLRGTLFCASDDETKQVLTGAHLSTNGSLELAVTDGHRLAVVSTPVEDLPTIEGGVTIPAKALSELIRMADSDTVSVKFDKTQAVFEWEDQRLTTRLLEGQYPNYNQLIPKQFVRQLTVDRRSLIQSLERIAVLADQKNNIVKFTLDQEQITLSVDAPDVGSGVETLSCQVTGDALDIAFNVKYLLEGLKAMSATEIVVRLNTATSPVVIEPIGGAKSLYLVMPVQIRS